MSDSLDKRYYRIGDVAQIIGLPESTLRFWEKEFTIISPKRNAKNTRLYTPKDIETIRMIQYLVKDKGLKLDAAQAMIKRNRDGVSKRFEVVERLKSVKAELENLSEALAKIKSPIPRPKPHR
ncbi:MAG: MerR family transcriptional regulator [Muribaculaceae bacterium]|nr:MerR family transcriptional regulator [Muribaculaceae bacterium]